MRPTDIVALEAEIELTAQELLAPLAHDHAMEYDDVVIVEIDCETADAANAEESRHTDVLQETSEIELTPEQMDAMLEGRWP